tara:strand:+ start:175 stop:357 length:183 start_codon:yes stop_codon:yes gene_type:complete
MFKNEFLQFQDKLFVLKRIIKEEDQPVIEVWKDHLSADTVLRKDGNLYFLETVPDLEIIQ